MELDNLAFTHLEKTHPLVAEFLRRWARQAPEDIPPPWALSSPDVAEAFSGAAKNLYEQENYTEAEHLLKRVLAIYKHLHGKTHPTVAMVLYDLANLHKVWKNYAEAEDLLVRTNLIRVRALGPEHPDTILSLSALGDVYAAQGKREEAETIYLRALTNCDLVLSPEDAVTAQVLARLVALYEEWVNTADTKDDVEQEERMDGENADPYQTGVQEPLHLDTAKTLHKLALLYVRQAKWEQAEVLYQRVLPVYENVLGSMHPDTLQCQHELAFLFMQQGKLNAAEAVLRQVLEMKEQLSGPKHPDVAAALNDLAAIYMEQEKFEQAEQVLQGALAANADLPEAHPIVAASLSNLAAAYLGQKKYQQATLLVRRALVILEQALGPEDPETAEDIQWDAD